MVYTYSDAIEKSGINRTMFPASCSSFMEMGLYIEAETARSVNLIMNEAGNVELNKFANNTLNEAAEDDVKKSIVKRVVDAIIKAWEAVKGVFEKFIKMISDKIEDYGRKFGKKFAKLDLKKYKTVLEKVAKGKKTIPLADSFGKISGASERVAKAYRTLRDEINTAVDNGEDISDKYDRTYIYSTLAKAVDSSLTNTHIKGMDMVKENLDKYFGIQDVKDMTAEWIIKNQANIVGATSQSMHKSDINKQYKAAKVVADESKKTLDKIASDKKTGEQARKFCSVIPTLYSAYNSIIMYLLDVRKNILWPSIILAARCVFACKVGAEDGEKVKKESAPAPEVSYNAQFVNEAFNW